MAPATLAGATPGLRLARGGWDRDSIIQAIQEWVALYGEPPRAADWNPSSAKWSGQLWRVERYRAGRPDGSPWPALNSAKRPFGGSLSEAIRAAGFEPAKPGPVRRRDVDPEQANRAEISPEGRAMVSAALARARDAEKRAGSLESQVARARERATRLADERDAARAAGGRAAAGAKPKVIRERVIDDAAIARARKRATAAEAKADAAVRELREQITGARMEAAEARAAAKRLASKLERAEATVTTLRCERRELMAGRDRAADELVAVQRLLEAAREDASQPREVVTIREEAPEGTVLREAQAAAAAARRSAEEAELRAARAERELRETVAVLSGEPRRLTADELAELRSEGPSGPAVMAQALKALAAARSVGGASDLRAALSDIARAAVTWREQT
ncbi:MAG TPA: hypothetical protein VGV40_10595 [Solirubrobacteraceae bacterium]|nr:hypothetical protein [Solirubrobacteraceae bacterium]